MIFLSSISKKCLGFFLRVGGASLHPLSPSSRLLLPQPRGGVVLLPAQGAGDWRLWPQPDLTASPALSLSSPRALASESACPRHLEGMRSISPSVSWRRARLASLQGVVTVRRNDCQVLSSALQAPSQCHCKLGDPRGRTRLIALCVCPPLREQCQDVAGSHRIASMNGYGWLSI